MNGLNMKGVLIGAGYFAQFQAEAWQRIPAVAIVAVADSGSVFCLNRRVNPTIAGEDQSFILVTFRSGVPGLIDANRISGPVPAPVAMNSLTVEGESATLDNVRILALFWEGRFGSGRNYGCPN